MNTRAFLRQLCLTPRMASSGSSSTGGYLTNLSRFNSFSVEEFKYIIDKAFLHIYIQCRIEKK